MQPTTNPRRPGRPILNMTPEQALARLTEMREYNRVYQAQRRAALRELAAKAPQQQDQHPA